MLTAVDADVIGRTAEMIVHRDNITRLQERSHNHVLGGTSLMSRHHVTLAQHVEYCLFEPLERLAAGIGVISPHHRSQLEVTHCVGATVCQHVQINICRIHAVSIETALFQGPVSLIYGK